jgi:hypothetical protein
LADGSVPADEIKSRLTAEKARKTALTAKLEKLQHVTQVASVDADQLKRTLRERVGDVIGLLERQTPQARQMLRKLLADKIELEPVGEGQRARPRDGNFRPSM